MVVYGLPAWQRFSPFEEAQSFLEDYLEITGDKPVFLWVLFIYLFLIRGRALQAHSIPSLFLPSWGKQASP